MLLKVYEKKIPTGIALPVSAYTVEPDALELEADEYFVIGLHHPSFATTQYLGSRRIGSDLIACWVDCPSAERHRTALKAQSVLDRVIKNASVALIADAEIFRVEVTQ